MSFGSKLSGLLSTIRGQKARDVVSGLYHRLTDELQERRLGIRTRGFYSGSQLGHQTREFGAYLAAPYGGLRWGLRQVSIAPDRDALLDIGSGLGRALVVAGTKPFRRVVGVEISPALAERASENVARAHGLRAPVEVVVADAREYEVPDDITVVHLFNPFSGSLLKDVIQKLHAAVTRRPRPLTIIYGNPGEFERMKLGEGWATRRARRVFYPNTEYAVYDCPVYSDRPSPRS